MRTEKQREYDRQRYLAKREEKLAYQKAYRLVNPEKVKAAVAAWHADLANQERRKQYFKEYSKFEPFLAAQQRYRDKNTDKAVERNKVWREQNPDKNTVKSNRYRAAKLKRIPTWLSEDDQWMIEEAYELARRRTEMFGYVWHVDHIILLQGKLVSGLHVPTNLQVVPAKLNLRKNRSYSVE